MDSNPAGVKFGRFQVLKPLGEGSQGRVVLAHDPHLDRSVAIKTLRFSGKAGEEGSRLVAEARTVSKLTHPHIVTLFDAGEANGEPYLVLEYVEGKTLQEVLHEQGKLSPAKAVAYAIQILEAVAYAHANQILHRDLKPSNVMIDTKGAARVMDFGIAVRGTLHADGGFAGTPLYCAPEYLEKREYHQRSEVYACAMMLYHMLAGAPAYLGKSAKEVVSAQKNIKAVPASKTNPDVDEKLDGLLLRGIAKRAEERFASAGEMSAALKAYLEPTNAASASDETRQSTVDFLIRRMKHKPEFPALSESIRAINRIASSDTENVSTLSSVILKDFALTNKLLKLVNAATYGQFGKVSTISRAVVVVGFDTVRHMAVSLMLINHMQNQAQAENLKEEAAGSLLSGILAREIFAKQTPKDSEEAFVCAMYQNLGRMLAMYYFHEEALEIGRLQEQKGVTESQASAQVLGVPYEDLALEIAKMWNFPQRLVHSMKKIRTEKAARPTNIDDRLRVVANLASEMGEAVTRGQPDQRAAALNAVAQRYSAAMPLNTRQLAELAGHSLKVFAKEAPNLNVNLKETKLVRQAPEMSATILGDDSAVHSSQGPSTDAALDASDLDKTVIESIASAESTEDENAPPQDAAAVLTAGIQDITQTLVSDYKLNDLLRMILETMYRGMGFSRALLAVKDTKQPVVLGRFGLGEGADELVKRFQISLNGGTDIFSLALKSGRDVLISDSNAVNVNSRLPAWYRERVTAKAFVLFPILVDKNPIGVFYADRLDGKLQVDARVANLLTTLRNQAVLAFKQVSMRR